MYTPDSLTLQKYAAVLVNFALHHGQGVKANEVVECVFPEHAKPLAKAIHRQLLKSQAHPLMSMQGSGFEEDLFRFGQEAQHRFFPEEYLKAKTGLITHTIYIIDPAHHVLTDRELSVKQIRQSVLNPIEEWIEEKEGQGLYSRTIALWPSEKISSLAGLSLKVYWRELLKACQLDQPHPIKSWQQTFRQLHQISDTLNTLPITSMHIEGEDIDLRFSFPKSNHWLAGTGKNIPSYEVFTSPDYRTVTGRFKSNQIVTKSGFTIEEPEFYFEAGRLTKFKAHKTQTSLETLLEVPGMNQVGEVSLTDKKLSPINKRLAVTLLDENMGGEFGNFHLALGRSFKQCYKGNPKPQTEKGWAELGYNTSVKHVDFVSTTDRKVTITNHTGETQVIYENGQFRF